MKHIGIHVSNGGQPLSSQVQEQLFERLFTTKGEIFALALPPGRQVSLAG